MKSLTKLSLVGLFALLCTGSIFSQVTTTGGQTAQQLAEILAGPNITVTNATLTGAGSASGSFGSGNSSIGFDSGVILSSGNINEAPGPNGSNNTGVNLGTGGTAQMTALAGVGTQDAITLEFDFEVQSSFIQFNYVFASEEYPEFAPPNNSGFNDVFAFFISGPGITGEENIALVPATTNPVTINNINAVTNNQYYIDNAGGADVEYDAFTTILEASRNNLTACAVYHLKLVIADAGDGIYSSAVFLQENSLVQGLVQVETQTVNSDDIALEGCIPASFTFAYDDVSNQDRIITYYVGGTAVNGVDYQFVDSSLTIVAGDTSATIYIDAFSDGLTEGQESVWIIYQPAPCAPFDTAFLFINDAQPIEFTLDGFNLDCFNDNSGEIQVNATGGFPPYNFEITYPDNSQGNETNNPITGLEAGTYSVQVFDSYGCQAEALVIGGIFDADTTFLPDVPGGTITTYDAPLVIAGFNPGQVITDVSQIQQICLTMEHSYLGDLWIEVEAPSGETITLKPQNGGGSCDLGEPFATGPVDGSAGSLITDPGNGFEYCFNASPIYGTMVAESNNFTHTIPAAGGGTYTDNYLPAGSYTSDDSFAGLVGADMNGTWIVHVTDQFNLDNGYIFNWYISLIGDLPDTLVVLTQPIEIITTGFIVDATCGGSDGSINLDIQNAVAPYTVVWSSGQTTEDISGIPAGSYTVTVTDGNGCTSIETFLVNNIGSLSITASSTPTSCFGGNNGTINITPAGGSTPYTFAWSNGATSEDLTGLTAGTYTVSMTDQQGCIISEVITVGSAQAVTVNLVSLVDEECNTDNGSINISVSGGTGSFGYQWSNGSSTQDLSNLSSGTYMVNVIDGNGCTASGSYAVVNDVSNCSAFCFIEVEENTTVNEICGNANGSIDINVLNAVAPVAFSWSNGATTEDITGLTAGSYTVVATDANNCSEVITFTIVNDAGNLGIASSSVAEENCGNTNGSVNITVTGGAMPYTFAWSNGQTSEDISGLIAGTYNVTITDGNGCQTSQSFTVNNNAGSLAATASVVPELCTAQNGSINQTVTGGNGVLTYSWDSGQTTQDLTNLPAGTYECTITDQTGCYIIKQYVVTQSSGDITLVGSNITNEVCGNTQGAINITLTGNNLVFLWSNGATTEDLTGVAAGNYSCIVTNAQGCTFTTPVFSIINASGTLSVTTQLITGEICGNANGSINMNVSGGTAPYTFVWSNGSSNEDIVGLSAGSYTLTVTDFNGCSESHTMTVGSSAGTLAIQNAIVSNETCGDGTGSIDVILVGGTGPMTYSWDSGQSSQDLTGLSAGTYEITITDNNGCQVVQSYTITNQANAIAYTSVVTNEVCSNAAGSIALTVTGGQAPYTYLWSIGGTNSSITGLSSGTLFCTITDDNGCSVVTQVFTIGNTPNGITASSVATDASCSNNGSINLTVVGGANPLTFAWSNAETTEDIVSLGAGTYSYTVTDNNGCQVSGSADVIQTNGNITYTFAASSETCANGSGTIDLTPAGGTGPYTFVWSNGPTSEDLTGLSAGTYSCTITDFTGCSVTTTNINIGNLPGTLSITNVIAIDETCSNGLGSIDISYAGGANPITFAWSNGPTTEDISGLSSGTFSVIVTDNNGCQATTQAVVSSSAGAMAITQPIVTNENCGNADGTINITITGAQNPVTYVWSNGSTSQDITGLTAGSYNITATDANGCVVNGSYTLVDNGSSLMIASSSISDEYCGSGSGSVSVSVANGTAPYTYLWSNGGTTNTMNNLSGGIYTVVVTDAGGCSVNGTYTVNNNAGNLVVTGTVTDENCGNADGAIDITTNGGNLPLTFAWDSGQTTEDLVNISEGIYNLVVTDQFGCTANFNGTIVNITGGLGVSIDLITDENCGLSDGAIAVTTTGAGIISTVWNSGQTTEDLTGIPAGTYTIIVSTASCSVTQTAIVVNQTGTLATTFTYIENENCGNAQGFIDIDVAGGTAPYTYLWSDGQTTQDAISLTGGPYSVTITDDLGCEFTENFTVNNTNNTNMTASGNVTDIFCAADDGQIDLSINGGIGPFTYSWDNGETTQDITDLAPGNYTVIITDAANCQISEVLAVGGIQGSNLGFTALNLTDEFCGNQDGEVVFFTGGTADDYYLDGVNLGTFQATNLSAGTYLVAITDNQGCYVDSIIVIQSIGNFTLSEVSVDEICGQSDGAIDITVTGGAGLTYLWSNGATTEDLSGIPAGTYTVVVTDNSNCSVTISSTVLNQTGAFGISASTIVDDNCSLSTGSIDIEVVGTGPFTYAWDSGQTTQDIAGLSAGSYTVVVSDGANCLVTETFQVVNTTTYSVDIDVTEEFCTSVDGEIDLTITGGVGPFTFVWSNAETTEDIVNLAAGVYTVTIGDALNCQTNLSIIITQGSTGLELDNFVTVNDYCGQGIGDINFNSNGTADDYYLDGVLLPSSHAYNLTAGSYVISATDNQGCYVEETILVGVDVNFTLSEVTTDENCGLSDGAIDVTVSGGSGLTYSWDSGQVTEDIINVSAGTYNLTVTDDANCSVSISSIIVNQTGAFGISSATITDENCQDGLGGIDIEVTGTGPFNYTWSNGQSMQDLTGLSAGTYTVVITDGSNCQLTESYVVINNATFTVTANITEEYCTNLDGAIDLTVTGGLAPYTFSWDNGALTEDLINLDGGDYEVTIYDATNCQTTITYTVNEGSSGLQLVNFQVQDETCGQGDGDVNFGSAGTADDYYIDGVLLGQSQAFNLSAGTYIISATDNQGCYVEQSVVIGSTGSFTMSNVVANESCGQSNGAIDLTVTGGVAMTYLWSNGATTEDLSGLDAGTYTVTATSNGGTPCAVDYSVTVVDISTFNMSSTQSDDFCGTGIGFINQEIVFGTGLTYLWSTGATTQDVTGLTTGPYYCVVTDPAVGGCEDTLFYTVGNISNGVIISATLVSDTCLQGVGEIDLAITGGSGTFTYAWSNAEITEDITGLTPGTFGITVTDLGDGCMITGSYLIENNTTVFGGTGIVSNENCGQSDGAINVTLSSATTYTYAWDNGSTTEDLSGLSAGTYVLTATSAAGCDTTLTYVINDVTPVFNASGVVTHASCGTCTDGFINVTMPGSNYDYLWSSGATTQDASSLLPGQYTLTITSPEGCDTTLVFDVLNTISLGELELLNISIDILPNPATDYFTINYEMPEGQNGEIVITDAVGKLIKVANVTGADSLIIDANSMATGMYFVTLQSKEITKVKRVVVNRK
jgi:subtilisin-like proprotein convertase family protein